MSRYEGMSREHRGELEEVLEGEGLEVCHCCNGEGTVDWVRAGDDCPRCGGAGTLPIGSRDEDESYDPY